MGTFVFSGGDGTTGFNMLQWGDGDMIALVSSVLSSSHSSTQVTYSSGGELLQLRGSLAGYNSYGDPTTGTVTSFTYTTTRWGGPAMSVVASGFSASVPTLYGWLFGPDVNWLHHFLFDNADTMTGSAGGDLLEGYGGSDTIDGGAGDDVLFGENYPDDETLSSTNGDDNLNGGDGDDTLYGQVGNDTLSGGAGIDWLFGGQGNDSLSGGAGVDTVFYTDAQYGVTVSIGIDGQQNTGGGGIDTLSGFENIVGGGYNDTLAGNAGDNVIDGGGSLFDRASFAQALAGVSVSLAISGPQDTIGAGTDTLIDIEGLVGSAYDDTLIGNDLANSMDGGAGLDELTGFGGNDFLAGNAGADSLYGGDGDDVLFSGPESTPVPGSFFTLYPPLLDSGAEVDTLIGGAGNDDLYAGYGDNVDGGSNDTFGDTLYISFLGASEGVIANFTLPTWNIGGGVITGVEHIAWVEGSNFGDTITLDAADLYGDFPIVYGMGGDDTLIANYYTDRMYGGDGNDVVDGRNSQYLQRVEGGDGNDTLYTNGGGAAAYGDAGNDTIYANNEVHGGDGDDLLILVESSSRGYVFGDAGDDEIRTYGWGRDILGGTGNDLLVSGIGDDSFDGGEDTDTVDFRNATGSVTVNLEAGTASGAGIGTDTLTNVEGARGGSANDSIQGNGAANTLSGGGGADIINGNDGDDVLEGNTGNDTLNGGAGADAMAGGDGDDTYVVDNAGDVTSEDSALGGVDTVQSSVTRVLGANLENLVLTGSAAVNGYGNGLDNAITGNSAANALYGGDGNDVLDGGAGADAMTGNFGNDTYYVDNAGDTVSEGNIAGGTDTVFASVSFFLASTGYADHLTLTGTAVEGRGNALANTVTGNASANVLWGLVGDDTLLAGDGADTLYGGDGADVMDGGTGADAMIGNFGDDAYYVDDAGDTVSEGNIAGGVDQVFASVSFSLGPTGYADHLTLSGAALEGRGNTLGNTITGNLANNVLWGLGGDDVLIAGAGADTLHGGDGADQLDGGDGADAMVGNFGDDTYYVDNAGDTVSEGNIAGGADTVYASVSFSLGPTGFGDHLTLTGGAAINATGNGLANILTGNSAANVLQGNAGDDVLNAGDGNDTLYGADGNDTLDGGTGADAMIGNLGDDLYYVDNAGDTVSEGSNVGGTDIVYASVSFNLGPTGFVERLTLTGTDAINATGNAQANTLTGNAGANTLTGAAGADSFVFASALGGSNVDAIADFSVADDTIVLDNAVFGGLTAGALDAGAFVIGPSALDADDRIIYDTSTGQLFFDADGAGGAGQILFATLTAGLALTNADFIVSGP